jgi:hypothetical protein
VRRQYDNLRRIYEEYDDHEEGSILAELQREFHLSDELAQRYL